MKFERKTLFSTDRKHRYLLWRESGCDLFDAQTGKRADDFVQFVGLNPSTANETEDDPTIRRCIALTKRWGYGCLAMTNIFSMVTAYPNELDDTRFSDENRELVMDAAKRAGMIICCWGNFSQAQKWGRALVAVLVEDNLPVFHLGLNQNGSPKHPLYLKSDTLPTPYASVPNVEFRRAEPERPNNWKA
jgi:hypothetical protein